MTRDERFAYMMTALSRGCKGRMKLDEADMRVYDRRLQAIPIEHLEAAAAYWMDHNEWFPTIANLKTTVAQVQQAMSVKIRQLYSGCINCEEHIGWQKIKIGETWGLQRCPCLSRHIDKSLREANLQPLPTRLPPGFTTPDDGGNDGDPQTAA